MSLQAQDTSDKTLEDYQLLEETQKLRTAKSSIYVKKEERYQDLGSTAIVFLGFGLVGDILVILNLLGFQIIPWLAGNIVSNIILLVMFTGFFIIGITSWRKAKKLKAEIGTEENITEKINSWMAEHITKAVLDKVQDASLADEINFLNKLDYMKELVSSEFSDVEIEYIEMLTEEFYNKNFD